MGSHYQLDLARAPDGDLYVVTEENMLVTEGCAVKSTWPARGTSLAMGILGDRLYLVDTARDRILVLSPDGQLLGSWGSAGIGTGEFDRPSWAAVHPSGRVYVVDSGNARIQAFDRDGNFIATWGTKGSGAGQFDSPFGIAIDGTGRVYVSDESDHRVQVFTESGVFLFSWGSPGTSPGQFDHPGEILVTAADDIYVVDRGNHRIQLFSYRRAPMITDVTPPAAVADLKVESITGPTSASLAWTAVGDDGITGQASSYDIRYGQIPLTGLTWGEFVQVPFADAPEFPGTRESFTLTGLTRNTTYYIGIRVADEVPNRSSISNVVTLKTADIAPAFESQWGGYGSGIGKFNYPTDVAVGPSGEVYVLDSFNNRIQVFDSEGRYLKGWGGEGQGDGEFRNPWAITIDGDGDVYVADSGNARIQKFSADGTFLLKWTSAGGHLGAIAIGPDGLLYALATTEVRVFEKNGVFVRAWGKGGQAIGELNSPSGLAIDADGVVRIVDAGGRVQSFSYDGSFRAWWIGKGISVGDYSAFNRITVDSDGDLYMSGGAEGWALIMKYDVVGELRAYWGAPYGGVELVGPMGLVVTQEGLVYVADAGGNQIVKYAYRD